MTKEEILEKASDFEDEDEFVKCDRLLYTPNKGYVRHGEPDVDEDFTLDIEEESFSSYVMTLDQSWYKLGNVYAGIGFLKEKE